MSNIQVRKLTYKTFTSKLITVSGGDTTGEESGVVTSNTMCRKYGPGGGLISSCQYESYSVLIHDKAINIHPLDGVSEW